MTAATASDFTADLAPTRADTVLPRPAPLTRAFAWSQVAVMCAYCVATYMAYWWGWPTLLSIGQQAGLIAGPAPANLNVGLAAVQVGIYVTAVLLAIGYVLSTASRTLRADAETLNALTGFFVRATYWSVLIIGAADVVISALRVEGLLSVVLGDALATNLGRPSFRGLYVHTPLLVLAVIIAALTRSLGFVWLCLLVVLAEFQIVVTRFIFSYEQGYMGDIVRFWYAALFLLASPYTLREEGHVRVDVVYAGLDPRTKGFINFFGSIVLGMALCWVIIALGTWTRSSVIVGPLISFEVTQSGFGLYIKYLMAALLGMFALTMHVQFASYMLDALADWRAEPGGRRPSAEIGH